MLRRYSLCGLCINVVFVLCVFTNAPVTEGHKIIRTSLAIADCHPDDPLFSNPQLHSMLPKRPVSGSNLTICTSESSCCTPEMEQQLLWTVRKDFRALLSHNSRSVGGLLDTTAQTLRAHVIELTRQSENKTLSVFHQIYQAMAVLATDAVHKLYTDIVRHATTADPLLEVDGSVVEFFTELFPLAYHSIVNPRLRDYSADYKRCLREVVNDIRPFGNIPSELASQIQQTMLVVRVFLQALQVGADVLNQTESLFDSNGHEKCHRELVRLSYCPKCRGFSSKPCAGYCLNVLRGCLTHFSVLLDLPWNGYVDSLQQLISRKSITSSTASQLLVSIDDVVRNIDFKISEAIMHAMMQGNQLEEQVKKSCGAPQWSDDDTQPPPPEQIAAAESLFESPGYANAHVGSKRPSDRIKDSEKQIAHQLKDFLMTISKTRGFYGNMAESLCSDETYAETRDTADCWNGHRIGEYTKTVVAADVNAQKYNPELSYADHAPDMEVRALSEQLRSMRLAIVGLLSASPESESFMRDEEGSGDGHQYVSEKHPTDDEDSDKNMDQEEGSGSGDGPIDEENTVVSSHDLRPKVSTSQGEVGSQGVAKIPSTSIVWTVLLTNMYILPRYLFSSIPFL